MKAFYISLIILIIPFASHAQCGVYKTYDDFVNNNLTYLGEKFSYSMVLGNFVIKFKDKKTKVKTKYDLTKEKIWGYKNHDRLYRIYEEKDDPYYIAFIGKLIIYAPYDAEIQGDNVKFARSQFDPKISKGLNSEMMDLNYKNMIELLSQHESGKDFIAQIEATTEKKRLFKNVWSLERLVDTIKDFDDYVEKE